MRYNTIEYCIAIKHSGFISCETLQIGIEGHYIEINHGHTDKCHMFLPKYKPRKLVSQK